MIYEALLLIGAIGLAAMSLMSFAHGGGASHGAHAGGGAVARGPVPSSPGQSPGLHGHLHGHVHATNHFHFHLNAGSLLRGVATLLLSLFSPLTIFSLCLGAGASGLLAEHYTRRGPLVLLIAILGAWVFYGLIVRPLWRLIFSFASKPAETLSGAVAKEAVAAGRFDRQGRGIVTLTVDGQVVRLLAHLDRGKDAAASSEAISEIAAGDSLLVTGVDTRRGTCSVTKL